MRKSLKITISTVLLGAMALSASSYIYMKASAANVPALDWLQKKIEAKQIDDKDQKGRAQKQGKLVKEAPDYSKINTGNPPREKDQQGIFTTAQFSLQLPSIVLNSCEFSNVATTNYDVIAAGNLIDDPNTGTIIDSHIDKKTSQTSRQQYNIASVGKITITEISNDGDSITFKTASGKDGTFDTTNGTYSLK